jgi:diguanylate cyclase (GGDEF)-like protein
MSDETILKVLLIEDNPADARMVDILLADGPCKSYQLTHIERLDEALALSLHETFDVALLDLNLPDGSGMAVFKALHAQNDQLPIIILTGMEDHELGRSMVKAGAQSYLTKGDIPPEFFYNTLQHSIERQQLNSELRLKNIESERAHERFRSLIENNIDAILVIGADKTIRFANPSAELIFSANEELLVGHTFDHDLSPGKNFELHLNKTGVTLEANVATIEWNNDDCFLVTLRNITKRKQLEESVLAEKKFLNSVVNGVKDPIIVTNMDCQAILKNSASTEMEATDLGQHNWPFRCYEADRLRSEGCPGGKGCMMAQVRNTAVPARTTKEINILNGTTRYFDVNITPLQNAAGEVTGAIEASRDITDRMYLETSLRRNQEKMRHLALHDTLTGLPNRLLFKDRLQRAIIEARRNSEKLALLFLDMDRFKNINDSLGHDYGDNFLKVIATRLESSVRESDTVARLGGDEFVVLLSDIEDPGVAASIAHKFLSNLSQSLILEQQEHFPSASIGISFFPADAENAEDLMKCSDSAMYLAKEKGRGNFQFFTSDLKNRADKLVTLEAALCQAIDLDHLVLHYQPQCDLITGKTIGFEALVRWMDPIRGLVPPNDFIPIAEDTGLIIPLGEWVLNKACQDHKNWLDQGMPLMRMSVNISPRQFHHGQLLQTVKRVLKTTGLKPEFLELEITESSIMYDATHAIEVMNQLRKLGVNLAIDDFGAGYSSLLRLMDFPITKLKIDRGFVKHLGEDLNYNAFTKVIISLAEILDLEVVAEGVENQEQADILIENGCRAVQGYFYGRPQPWDQKHYPVTDKD